MTGVAWNGANGKAGLIWSEPFAIELGWLDGNGHLNMAYYHVMFDRTIDIALDALGLGTEYRIRQGSSVFNVETHVVYRREVHAEDRVRVSVQLLGRDEKRLHAFQTMMRLGDDELVATSESLFVHVDLAERRSAPLPLAARARADEMIRVHREAGEPGMAGRRIAPLGTGS